MLLLADQTLWSATDIQPNSSSNDNEVSLVGCLPDDGLINFCRDLVWQQPKAASLVEKFSGLGRPTTEPGTLSPSSKSQLDSILRAGGKLPVQSAQFTSGVGAWNPSAPSHNFHDAKSKRGRRKQEGVARVEECNDNQENEEPPSKKASTKPRINGRRLVKMPSRFDA
jgi:hypothetical protein